MSNPSTAEMAALAEWSEAEFMYGLETLAPPSVRARLGIAGTRVGGGVVLAMRHDPVQYWSKALGFGVTEPVTRDVLDEVVAFYRDQGTPSAVIQIAPQFLPSDWDEIIAAHALAPVSSWVRLMAPSDRVRPAVNTRLRVGPVGEDDAEEWASVLVRGHGMPADGLAEMLLSAFADPSCHPFAVWDGTDVVGGATLSVHDPVGSLHSASVLPSHRRLGGQTALIAARAEAARSLGCRWLASETGNLTDGRVNQSLNNMRRAGLRVQYVRQNWRWRAESSPRGAV
ncbi:GNAT family N-acetyltransferase [Plantactinospora sp. WMMC1484]|uniref:GNAT family N-acetyltransferase n=1 Tax=Plantactinospora sp. WMMC1484 TaxID=3404122 RepID=UPI003BF52A34